MKVCGRCGEEKALSAFPGKLKKHNWCSVCKNEYERVRRSTSMGRKAVTSSHLKASYGITLEEYEGLLEAQEYRCAICGWKPEDGDQRLSVDHCHGSGRIRGLLCTTCNTMLGMAKDTPDVLRRAADYLEIQ